MATWQAVSGKTVKLEIGDVTDWEFLSQARSVVLFCAPLKVCYLLAPWGVFCSELFISCMAQCTVWYSMRTSNQQAILYNVAAAQSPLQGSQRSD